MASVIRLDTGDTLRTGDLALRRCPTCGEEYPSDYLVCPRDATALGIDREVDDPMLGMVLAGTYRIVRAIGRGGMGRLYEAQHARLDRRYAIKVLHEAQHASPEAQKRFEREARALSRIRSDHVLDVIDVVKTADHRTAIVTARLDGEDLKARLDRVGKLDVAQALPIARQICLGLAAAHAHGVIHRDLKPSNVFLESGADGSVTTKLLDFGVAKLAGEPELTRTGAVVGTPAYMAPEQARGSAEVDERADVYGVGAVLYRALTGRSPYVGDDAGALLAALIAGPPRRPRAIERSIPVGLEAVIQRAMADRNDRPSDALELERELAAFDTGATASVTTWEPSTGAKEVDTLVLPRGSVARAQTIAKEASRARPLAVLLAIVVSLACGAIAVIGVAGLSTLEGAARTQSERSAAWLLGGAAIVGALAALVRWLGRAWTSVPDVLRVNRALAAALLAGAASSGLYELAARASDALDDLHPPLAGGALVVRAALPMVIAALAGAWAARRKTSRGA
jgi:serine/threonine protein kinase